MIKKQLKITILADYFQPKIGYAPTFLSKEFDKIGHICSVITSDRYFPFPNYEESVGNILGKRITSSGVYSEENIRTIRLRTFFEFKSSTLILLKGLYPILKKEKPDILILGSSFSPLNIQFSIIYLFLRKKPFVFFNNHASTFNTKLDDTLLKKIYFYIFDIFFKNLIIKTADYFIPIGESESYILKIIFGDRIRKKILPLGSDTKKFSKNNKNRKEIRKKLSVESKTSLIIYAGKITPNKDLEILIKAFSNILEKVNFKAKLLIIGGGDQNVINKLNKILKEKKVINRVIFKEFMPNNKLPHYYNAADIGIWPGNLSNTIQEAMATGLPVILPKDVSKGQNTDHLAMNDSALQFTRGDYFDLSKKILSLINDKSEIKKRSKNCYNLIRKKYSWDVIAQQYIDLYNLDRKK